MGEEDDVTSARDARMFLKEASTPKCQRVIGIFFAILLVVYAGLAMGFAISANNKLSKNTDQIEFMLENWQERPIVDMTVDMSPCQQGYIPMFDTKWPGTHTGCDCTSAWSYYGIKSSSCSYNQTRKGCHEIRAIQPIQFKKFEDRLVCVKHDGLGFMTAPRPDSQGKCPKAHKICGLGKDPSAEPSYSRAMCVPQNDPCPINDVKVINNADPVPEGYSYVQLANNRRIIYTNTSEGLPVIEFKLTEGKPCIDNEELDITPGRYIYTLLNKNNYNGCKTRIGNWTHDSRYQKIGSTNEETLFENNGVMHAVQNLPDYKGWQFSRNYNYNLYSRTYIDWELNCDKTPGMSRADIQVKYNNIAHIMDWQDTVYTVSIVNFVLIVIMSCCYTCISVARLMKHKDLSTGEFWAGLIQQLIAFGFLIALFCLFYKVVGLVTEYEATILQIKTMSCSDAMTDYSFQAVGDGLINVKKFDKLALMVTVGMGIFELFNFCYFCVIKYQKENED